MATTIVKGIYKNGQIILENKPNIQEEVEVIVTFLEKEKDDRKGEPKSIRIGSMEGLFEVPDDFDEPLSYEFN